MARISKIMTRFCLIFIIRKNLIEIPELTFYQKDSVYHFRPKSLLAYRKYLIRKEGLYIFWSKFGNFCQSDLCNYNLLPEFLSLQHSLSNAHSPNQCNVKRKHRGLSTGQKSVFKFLSKFEDTTIPVLYTVSQQATFWNINSSVWAVRAVREKSGFEEF